MADSSGDQTATFNLNVESNAAQISAEGAQGLANLQERMQGSVAELRNMNAALRSFKGAAGVSSAAVEDLKNRIAEQRTALAAQNQAYIKSGGTFKDLAERNKAQAAHESATAKAKATQERQALQQAKDQQTQSAATVAMGAAVASGYLAIAAAAVEVAKTVADAAVALIRYGVAAADARRSELLQLEGFTKIRYGLFGVVGGYRIASDSAGFLQTQLDAVADSSAVGRTTLAGYEQQLYRTGLRAGNLQAALEGMSIVAAAQGEEQAQRFAGMAAGARYAGVSVRALADDVKARLGGIAEARMLSLDVQSQKLHESFARLFSGLKIDPLLRGMREVTSLFSINTAQGLAMQQILEGVFQPLIDDAPTAGLIAKKVITGMLIGAEVLYGKYLDLRIAWTAIFGNSEALDNVALAREACAAAAIGVGLLGGAVAIAAVDAAALAAPFLLAAAAGWEFGKAVFYLDEHLKKWGSSSVDLGLNFVRGIANGLFAGVPELVTAITHVGDAAITAFRAKLGIHSPSRVMFGDGRNIVRGQIGGIRAERPALEREVEASMVRPVLGPMGDDAPARQAGSRAAAAPARAALPAINFTGDINVSGHTADELKTNLRRALEEALSGALVLAGGQAA